MVVVVVVVDDEVVVVGHHAATTTVPLLFASAKRGRFQVIVLRLSTQGRGKPRRVTS